MVKLLEEEKTAENGSKTKTWFLAWLLSISILIISGLTSVFGYLSIKMISDFRQEFIEESRENRKINHSQDLCIKELQTHQNERLERERKGIKVW